MMKQYDIELINIDRELKGDFTIICNGHLMAIEQSLINWNNCYIFIRYKYILMLKYKELLENCINKEQHEAFDYWYKKYIEETIKGLNELYDKSFHIINNIFDFCCVEETKFKGNIFDALQNNELNAYNKMAKINNKYRKCISQTRNNIEHNSSDLFPKIIYKNHGEVYMYKAYADIDTKKAMNIINELIVILKDEAKFIQECLSQKFPTKFINIE